MDKYRLRIREIDKARFVVPSSNETGVMPVISQKGEFKPILCQTQPQILQITGNPSSSFPSVFEALAFVKSAPIWIVPVIGDNALYSGVDVKRLSITGESVGTGDASEITFTKTLANGGIDNGSLVIKVDGTDQEIIEDAGIITGSGITGTLDKQTGALSVTFSTAPANTLAITANYDYASVIAFSQGKDFDTFNFNTFEDLISDESIDTGNGALTNFTGTLSNLPVKGGSFILKVNGVDQEVTESAGVITGSALSAGTLNLTTGELDITFNTAPANGAVISTDYIYTRNATDVSFSIFAKSQYDAQLAVTVENTGGQKYTVNTFDILSTGNNFKNTYEFSLIREKNGLGVNLYYEDVLDDNFADIKLQVNENYITPYAVPKATTEVAMSGGTRGDTPQSSDFQTAWNFFRTPEKYKGYILMDAIGGYSSNVNTISVTYQPHAFGISIVPFGNDATEAVTYRQATGIDSDQVSLYTNWVRIQDTFNDSFAWISNIGSIGAKMAVMAPVYNQASPAGFDQDGYGGQLQNWTVVEAENDYTDLSTGGDIFNLDQAQVNPIIYQNDGNLVVQGDRTLIQVNTDTSFIGHRRLLNLIIETMKTQILKFKVFKNITETNLSEIRITAQNFLNQLIAAEVLNDALADTSANTPTTRDQRKMILSLYIQAVPNAQIVELQIIRVGQTVTVTEVAGS